MVYSIETWPCYSLNDVSGLTNASQIACSGCSTRGIISRIILYGQPYNANTIEAIQVDSRMSFDKVSFWIAESLHDGLIIKFLSSIQDFVLCRNCLNRCQLFHKIAHQKYLTFIECSKKVAEKNSQDPLKGTTVILNELLADEAWLAQVLTFIATFSTLSIRFHQWKFLPLPKY